jgi:hypothetical protein
MLVSFVTKPYTELFLLILAISWVRQVFVFLLAAFGRG